MVRFGVVIGGGFLFSLRTWLRDPIVALSGRDIFPQDIYFLSSIPAHTNLGDLLTLCLMAALVPAWFAARVDPEVALRDGGWIVWPVIREAHRLDQAAHWECPP